MDVNESVNARRVELFVSIGGHAASGFIAPYLLSFSYTDNAGGKADEVQLELQDRDGRWAGEWAPSKGTGIVASLRCRDWFGTGQDATLDCGAFVLDEIEYSGVPDKISIKAVSASLTSPLRDTVHTKAWENYSLQGVAGEIAGKNGLSLLYQAPTLNFERQEQREESDLGFLTRLAQERGINVKVHNNTLALYAAKDADAQAPRLSIPKKGGQFSPKSYRFKESSQDTAYSGCEVSYMDPDTRETYHFAFDAQGKSTPLAAEGAQKFVSLNQRVESEAEARAYAQSQLRDKNQSESTGSLELMGHPDLMAGTTVELSGFGKFSGTYFVEKAEHRVGSGYTTSAEMRRVLGY